MAKTLTVGRVERAYSALKCVEPTLEDWHEVGFGAAGPVLRLCPWAAVLYAERARLGGPILALAKLA